MMLADMRQSRINTKSGVALSVAERGGPEGRPLVLLHGYTDSWRCWEPLLASLPGSFRAVAPTHRGHGDSAKPSAGYRFEDFARDLRDVVDELGIERAVVVGHSMGSLVAMRFALDHPSRVEALVLIGACATVRGNEEAGALWRDGVAEMTDPVDPAFVRAFQESTLARPVPPSFLDTVVAESGKVPARVWRDVLRSMLDEDFSGELGGISAPALIVWGDRDGICTRTDQERLLAALPRATLLVHEGAGHAPHWEDPRRVVADITGFLARTP